MTFKAFALHGLCLLAGLAPLPARDADSKRDNVPKETPLFVANGMHEGMDDRIFPLGWSADGKFAWVRLLSSEGMGDSRWELTIQDMGTNKEVETQKYDMGQDLSIGIRQFWSRHGKAVTLLVKKHGVKQAAAAMDHFPMVLGKRRSSIFLPRIESVRGKHDELQFEGVKSFQVFESQGDRTLALLQKTYDVSQFPFTVAIVGCYVSPDETHAAIVITACWRGWEGAPHPRRVEALAGFKTGIQ